jgi:hypothetical protein
MPETFTDVVLESINNLPMSGDFSTVMTGERWTFNDWLWRGDKVRIPSGKEDQFETMYRVPDSLVMTTPMATRNATIESYMVTAQQALKHMYFFTAWAEEEFDVQGGLVQNRGAAIVKVIEARRKAKLLGFYKGLESAMWKLPILTGDSQTIHGVPYNGTAITVAQVAAATNAAGAFQGANPALVGVDNSYGSDWNGVDLSDSDYSDMRNYCGVWDATSEANVSFTKENLRRVAKLMRNVYFAGPMDAKELGTDDYSNYRIATDEFITEQLGTTQREANDSLGNDLLKYLGTGINLGKSNNGVIINGLPVRYESKLDVVDPSSPSGTYETDLVYSMGAHPMWFVNLNHLYVAARAGKFMMKRPPARNEVNQPDAIVEYVDTTANIRCDNHQQGVAVLSWRDSS